MSKSGECTAGTDGAAVAAAPAADIGEAGHAEPPTAAPPTEAKQAAAGEAELPPPTVTHRAAPPTMSAANTALCLSLIAYVLKISKNQQPQNLPQNPENRVKIPQKSTPKTPPTPQISKHPLTHLPQMSATSRGNKRGLNKRHPIPLIELNRFFALS